MVNSLPKMSNSSTSGTALLFVAVKLSDSMEYLNWLLCL